MIVFDGAKYHENCSHHSPEPFEYEGQKRYLHGAVKTIDILNTNFKAHCPSLFFNGSVSIAKEDFEKISTAYYRFIDEVIRIGESAKAPDKVIYISNNLFHVAKTLDTD